MNASPDRHPGGRPTRFGFDLGVELLGGLDQDLNRREIAARSGIGLRTLTEWIRRGRRGETRFAWFASAWDQQERARRRIRFRIKAAASQAAGRRRWREFADSREAWRKEKLGPREFWRRRLKWLADRGMDSSFAHAVAEMEQELGPHSFGAKLAP
jgi:hypothetical protein